MSVVGDEKVKVPILRDTGAHDSFIKAGILPLSSESETGRFIPVRGMDLCLWVPLHKVKLEGELFSLPLSDFPVSLSHSDLVAEQQADPYLKELFRCVQPEGQLLDSASGYFLQDSFLVRKWVQHSGSVVGDPVFR